METPRRRLILADSSFVDDAIKPIGGQRGEIDVTLIDHADTTWPISAVVQERCSLGHWHILSRTDIPPWGSRL